jgi:hypothetical protein
MMLLLMSGYDFPLRTPIGAITLNRWHATVQTPEPLRLHVVVGEEVHWIAI